MTDDVEWTGEEGDGKEEGDGVEEGDDVVLEEEEEDVLEEDVDVLEEDVDVLEEDVDVLEEDVDVLEEDVDVLEECVDVVLEEDDDKGAGVDGCKLRAAKSILFGFWPGKVSFGKSWPISAHSFTTSGNFRMRTSCTS